jgi:hypothetical protein
MMADNTNTQADAEAKAKAEAQDKAEKQSKAEAKGKIEAELKRPDRYIVDNNIVDPDGKVIMPLTEK